MDAIRFVVSERGDGGRLGELRIRINGTDLATLVRVQEAPFAEAEGSPSIAGGYAGLAPGPDTLPPSGHFLGRPSNRLYAYRDKVQVMECECGEPGCWPLLCRIVATPDTVTWSDFEQPHRTAGTGNPHWRYDEFGPFVFERRAYEDALASAAEGGTG